LQGEAAKWKNRRTEKMKKTQAEGSELKRGWPSKEVMAGRSGGVFSLDFLFIEQTHATERREANFLSFHQFCARRPLTQSARR